MADYTATSGVDIVLAIGAIAGDLIEIQYFVELTAAAPSGYSGYSGYSGSGVSGYSGFSGISGYSGFSGDSGISGYSGFSGISGYSGDSGISGYSGFSGISGYSGVSPTVATTTTNAAFYPTFNSATSGSFTTANVDPNFTYNPSTGNLGIGTSSPNGKLDVRANTNGNLIAYVQNDSTGASAQSILQINSAGRYANLNSNYSGAYFQNAGTNLTTFYQDYDTQIFRANNGTERMRIDSSGNVGIGNSSPSYKLQVGDGTVNTRSVFYSNSAYALGVGNGSGFAGWIGGSGTADNMVFSSSGGTERMRIDSSGNVGIGITPSAWGGYRAIQVGGSAAVWSIAAAGSSSAAFFTQNMYYNGTNRIAINTGSSLEYIQDNAGNHIWYYAPSVTAGSVLTPVERMRIDTSGNVLPGANGTQNLGSASLRWANVYTSDLHLNNGIGNYTIVEGEEDLFLYNNKNGKTYKFALIEVDPSAAPAKMKE